MSREGAQAPDVLASASGLRPASAFVAIAAVLLAAAGRAAQLAMRAPGEQPNAQVDASAPWAEFEIVDRIGRPLALSVECFDVTVSPRALWRSHTPARMARSMGAALGIEADELLLKRMMPAEAEQSDGWIVPQQPELLRFDEDQAERVSSWLDGEPIELERSALAPLAGFELVPCGEEHWTLAWRPSEVLSAEERARQIGTKLGKRPERWTTRLLSDLALLVRAGGLPDHIEEDLGRLVPSLRDPHLRDLLWGELCPSTYRLVVRRVDPVRAHALATALREESVSPWQVQLVPRLERRHPARPAEVGVQAMGEGGAAGTDPFSVLGHWGVLGDEDAQRQAAVDLQSSPHLLHWEESADPLRARADELARSWRPWSGLEKLCADSLAQAKHELSLAETPRVYQKQSRHVSRDRRASWPEKRVPNYFVGGTAGAEVPRFEATLDARLQRIVHDELLELQDTFDPALAMAIAVDVESGDVLAVDAVQTYASKQFAPTQHVFTPGSTFKAVVMAMALDRHLVAPDEVVETYYPDGYVVRTLSGQGRGRRISEAEGAPDEAWITATQGLAQSVNAVLVQIGLRINAADMRAQLARMGYGTRPGAGLGPERGGHLPDLKNGSWKRRFTHASICFGHEIGVTLWQHADALATIARGGVRRPLRLISGLSQGSSGWDLNQATGERVLRADACENVLAMMAVGAREGTGERVAHPDMHPEFHYLGTKTGTTEKVETEVCIHVELAHSLQHQADGTSCSKACYRGLRGLRDHKSTRRTCYTSSMMAVGQLEPGGPKTLVLVVVEDARSKKKFGADVAGRAAVRMLRSAFALAPEHGVSPRDRAPVMPSAAMAGTELPWWQDAAEQEAGW